MIGKTRQSLLLILMSLLVACGTDPAEKGRPESIPLSETHPVKAVHIVRFDTDIYRLRSTPSAADVSQLRQTYGRFFELWCGQLAGIISPLDTAPSNAEIAFNLAQYLSDEHIRSLMHDCDSAFKDLEWLEKKLAPVMARFESGFPGQTVPRIITFVEPFNYKVMAMDSSAGIGLHYYLGSDYKYYPSLQLPHYMVRKMNREYMVHDLIKGWLDSEYLDDSAQTSCLSQMIYQGKVMFAMDLLDPSMHDTIKTGYSEEQYSWTLNHEYDLWAFFVGQKLLYNTNPKVYLKYIHDGNTTSGFPEQAPARLGPFIGWKIVRAYMKKHPEMNLKGLFSMKNAQSILLESGYQPEKNTD